MLDANTYRRLKGALTRAQNSGDPARVIATCDIAFAAFERDGYPDTWHRWNIARDDARFALAYASGDWTTRKDER